jgi:hypothetical protein
MISSFDIYLMTRLDGISFASIVVFCASLVVSIFLGISLAMDGIPNSRMVVLLWLRKFLFACIVALVLFVLTPTTKEFAVICLLPKITNSEKIQGIGSDAVNVLHEKLKEWVDDIGKKPVD